MMDGFLLNGGVVDQFKLKLFGNQNLSQVKLETDVMMCFCFFNKTPKTKVQLGGLLHSFLFSLLLQYCSMTSDGLDMMLCDVMTDRPTDMLNVLACACFRLLLEPLA